MTWQPGDRLYEGPGEGTTRPMIELIDDLEHVRPDPLLWEGDNA